MSFINIKLPLRLNHRCRVTARCGTWERSNCRIVSWELDISPTYVAYIILTRTNALTKGISWVHLQHRCHRRDQLQLHLDLREFYHFFWFHIRYIFFCMTGRNPCVASHPNSVTKLPSVYWLPARCIACVDASDWLVRDISCMQINGTSSFFFSQPHPFIKWHDAS